MNQEATADDSDGTFRDAAERTAASRKKKRFRLTRQQTQFLTSEFAKKQNPDAAHRERLSREIPGFNSRQVQVWFQNHRAKFKRLTVGDQSHMMKMRAVPHGFNNLQALHSPYGAAHDLNTPLSLPENFGTQSYADYMTRPLMVDVRKAEDRDGHMSSVGLTPDFGSISITPPETMSSPDTLSSMTPNSTGDHYRYGSYLLPMGPNPQTSNPFATQGALENHMSMHCGQPSRPLKPLHLRETVSRSRPHIQSSFRSSMSWEGDTVKCHTYYGAGENPQPSERQQSGYQPEQINGPSSSDLPHRLSSHCGRSYRLLSPYPDAIQTEDTVSLAPSINYSSCPHPVFAADASSGTLGRDLHNHYWPVGSVPS